MVNFENLAVNLSSVPAALKGVGYIVLILFLAYCVLNIIFKPRFARKAVLYVGTVVHDEKNPLRPARLRLSRKLLYKYNWKVFAWFFLPFTPVKVGGVAISPMRGKRIYCRERALWRSVEILPADYTRCTGNTPEEMWTAGELSINPVVFRQLTEEEKTKDERILETSDAFIPVKAGRGDSMTVICYTLLEEE